MLRDCRIVQPKQRAQPSRLPVGQCANRPRTWMSFPRCAWVCQWGQVNERRVGQGVGEHAAHSEARAPATACAHAQERAHRVPRGTAMLPRRREGEGGVAGAAGALHTAHSAPRRAARAVGPLGARAEGRARARCRLRPAAWPAPLTCAAVVSPSSPSSSSSTSAAPCQPAAPPWPYVLLCPCAPPAPPCSPAAAGAPPSASPSDDAPPYAASYSCARVRGGAEQVHTNKRRRRCERQQRETRRQPARGARGGRTPFLAGSQKRHPRARDARARAAPPPPPHNPGRRPAAADHPAPRCRCSRPWPRPRAHKRSPLRAPRRVQPVTALHAANKNAPPALSRLAIFF